MQKPSFSIFQNALAALPFCALLTLLALLCLFVSLPWEGRIRREVQVGGRIPPHPWFFFRWSRDELIGANSVGGAN